MPMLTIRNAQMRVLASHKNADFIRRLQLHLNRVREPDNAEQLDSFIRDGTAQVEEFGLKSERSVARFMELVWVRYGKLPQLPRSVLCFLKAYGMDQDAKLSRFEHWLEQSARKAKNV